MNRGALPFFSALALILSVSGPSFAGQMSFKEALELGLSQNHGLKAAQAATGAAAEEIGMARGYLLPKITFEERYMRTDNPTYAFSSKLNQERFSSGDFAIDSLNGPDAINDFQTSFSIEQPLFARKALVGLDMAKKEYAASRDELFRAREQAAFDIASACLTVNTAEGYVQAAQAGVADAKEHLRIAEARHESGLGIYSDALRARTGLLEAEQRLVSADKGLILAKRALGLLLGLEEEVGVEGAALDMPLRDVEHYLSSARERGDLKSMEKRRENARAGVSLANSGYFPTIGVGGAYFMNDHEKPFGSEGDSWLVSASLKWTLFDATRGHEAAKARLKSVEAQEHLEGLRQFVSFRVHQAYLNVEEARKNAELAASALKSAEEGERLVRLRYENSLSPLVDLLDAVSSLSGARAGAIMKKNAFAAALLSLSFESGTILNDLGISSPEGSR
ncbi:MAG: TolC family protein [Deltaproteobacteria bacterium]|nr:TolC family protein [Deltaproteobacteria bacterium]